MVVLYEESALSTRFGALYEDYRREVPRWLPRKPRPTLAGAAPLPDKQARTPRGVAREPR
jgi:hypothetical protein